MRCRAPTYEMTRTVRIADKESYRVVQEPSLSLGRDSQRNL